MASTKYELAAASDGQQMAEPGAPPAEPPAYSSAQPYPSAYPVQQYPNQQYPTQYYPPPGPGMSVGGTANQFSPVKQPLMDYQQPPMQFQTVPGTVPLQPGQPIIVNSAQGQQMIMMQPDGTYVMPAVVTPRQQTFAWHIALSCCILWCCCWPLGLVAFILAMCAVKKSKSVQAASARQLGIASLVLSGIGFVLGIIIIVILVLMKMEEPERD